MNEAGSNSTKGGRDKSGVCYTVAFKKQIGYPHKHVAKCQEACGREGDYVRNGGLCARTSGRLYFGFGIGSLGNFLHVCKFLLTILTVHIYILLFFIYFMYYNITLRICQAIEEKKAEFGVYNEKNKAVAVTALFFYGIIRSFRDKRRRR
jgi:hypothetical protein